MNFEKHYTVNSAHIDVQGIMDGLYYPFYMESCRHDFIREVLGFDLEEQARQGVFMVLSQYTIKYVRSLKKDDAFSVTCTLFADKSGGPRLHFEQQILMNGKLMTKAVFTGTCVPATGGRPYLPEAVKALVANAPQLEVETLK